ncbi:putative ferric-chelate reductase 1 [Pseudophryne corroboree]|uniref:putative ferric-chelate reductase 1 n=1 Tax=Pseudophryne corroboree TaxID=495146 RepID=UPI003081B60E
MMPEHGASAQTSTSPYILTLAKSTYSPGENIAVTLTSNSGATQFKGFLIQARSGSDSTPVGSFKTSSTNVQTLTCSSTASSVSHTSSTAKTSIQVTWVAPNSNLTDIQIRATVVQVGTIFWTNLLSPKIAYVALSSTDTSITTVGNITSFTKGTTTTAKLIATPTSITSSTKVGVLPGNSGSQLATLTFEKLFSFCAIAVTFALE